MRPRLLIVDDVLENRDLLCRRFQRRGFETAEADSGQRALDLLQQQAFDLVLLDIEMPGMDGLQTLARIRDRHSSACLPVIMVTGRTQQTDVMAAVQAAANDFITKPVDFEMAVSRVRAQLQCRDDAAVQDPGRTCLYVFQDPANFVFPQPILAVADERVVSALVTPQVLADRLGGCARYVDDAGLSYLGVWGDKGAERFLALLSARVTNLNVIRQRPGSARMEWRRSAKAAA